MHRHLLGAALLGIACIVGPAVAQAPSAATADELIAARQANMAAQSSAIEDMMLAIGAGTDITRFKDTADTIAELGQAIPGLFAPGTESGHATRALPKVWSDRVGFENLAAELVGSAQLLSKAAVADDRAEFTRAWRATFAACSACHMTYRGDRRTP